MPMIYSEKAMELFEQIEPYIEWDKFPARLKDDTPEEIKRASDEWIRLVKEEKQQYLEAMGLI